MMRGAGITGQNAEGDDAMSYSRVESIMCLDRARHTIVLELKAGKPDNSALKTSLLCCKRAFVRPPMLRNEHRNTSATLGRLVAAVIA